MASLTERAKRAGVLAMAQQMGGERGLSLPLSDPNLALILLEEAAWCDEIAQRLPAGDEERVAEEKYIAGLRRLLAGEDTGPLRES